MSHADNENKDSSQNKKRSFQEMMTLWSSKGNLKTEEPVPAQAEEVQKGEKLKHWPDDLACLPNEWVRSGLFSCSNKLTYVLDDMTKEKRRIIFSQYKVPSWSNNVKLYYSGDELNLFDLRIWMTCFRLGKKEYLGTELQLTGYEFCEHAGIPRGGKTITLAIESLRRIHRASIQSILYNKQGQRLREFNDHMIHWFDVKENGRLVIALNPRLKRMFDAQTTWIDWEKWNSVQSEVQKSLMLHISSHEAHKDNPQKISLPKLKGLMRNEQPMYAFRRRIKEQLTDLMDKGFVTRILLEKDILTFTRN